MPNIISSIRLNFERHDFFFQCTLMRKINHDEVSAFDMGEM